MEHLGVKPELRTQFWSVIVVGAVALVFMSLLWYVFSWPIEMIIEVIETGIGYDAGATNSVSFVRLFITYALPLIVAFGIIAWGYKTVIKERALQGPYEY